MLPFVLIEDLMDLQTVSECNKLFDFLNSRISFLIEVNKYYILQICGLIHLEWN